MNTFCEFCNCDNPTKFCICCNTVASMCDICTAKHEKQRYAELHDYNNIFHLDVCKSLGIDQFRARKSQIMTGSSFVQKLEEIEGNQYLEAKRKIEQCTKLYTDWLDYLHGCFTALISKFHQEKQVPLCQAQFYLSKFTYGVFEMSTPTFPPESPLVEQQPIERLQNEINELLVRLQQSCGPMQDFEEYFVKLMKNGAFAQAGLNTPSLRAVSMARPMQGYGQQSFQPSMQPVSLPGPSSVSASFTAYVPFSRGRLLAKWMSDTTNLDKVVMSRSLDFTNVSVFVVLPDGNLLSCAGREQQECRAVMINTTSGQVTMLPEMNRGRGNPGLAYINGVAYVFGGFVNGGDEELNSAEKLVLQQRNWTPITKKMASTRFQFTPFPYMRTIYIAGGWHTTGVEAFDIPTETFSTLPLVLPKPFGTTCFVYNSELVVLQDKKLIRWAVNSRSGDARVQSTGTSVKDSNVCVQVVGTKAYYSNEYNNKCEVHAVDLQTWEVEMVGNLSNTTNGNQPCPVS